MRGSRERERERERYCEFEKGRKKQREVKERARVFLPTILKKCS